MVRMQADGFQSTNELCSRRARSSVGKRDLIALSLGGRCGLSGLRKQAVQFPSSSSMRLGEAWISHLMGHRFSAEEAFKGLRNVSKKVGRMCAGGVCS